MMQMLCGRSNIGSSLSGMRRVALVQARKSVRSSSSSSSGHVRVYEEKRSEYKKAVSMLRKEYALEVEREKQSLELQEEETQLKRHRQRLERQRTKYIKAAASAQRERAKRQQQKLEFEEHLKRQEVIRKESHRLQKKAQSLLLAELEQEAPHWLTTVEEVQQTFLHSDVQQQLWTQPGGCIGAPRPTQDAEFWKYVSHTWDMSRTYPSPRDLLLEQIQDQIYYETNVDFDDYWTSDRLQQHQEIRQKAQLRALIRHEGRKSLLLQQRQLLQQQQQQQGSATNELAGVPKPMPVPKLQVLANKEAMEQEGVKILQSNLQKFINPKTGQLNATAGGEAGPTFPTFVGRLPRKDTRTEKEKKRDAREEKLLAAAAAKDAVEFAAEDSLQDGRKPLNYNQLAQIKDEEDIEWERDMLKSISDNDDIQTTKQLLSSIPSHERYTQDDIDWIISQLEEKKSTLTELYKIERLNDTSTIDTTTDTNQEDMDAAIIQDQEKEKDIDWDEWEKLFQLERIYEQHEAVLSSLTQQQIDALNDIPTTTQTTSDQLKNALQNVPGLTPDQIQTLIDLEMSLTQNQELLQRFNMMNDDSNNNKDPSE